VLKSHGPSSFSFFTVPLKQIAALSGKTKTTAVSRP